jgi:glyceraldehyde-3-phosphate dehydrogenase (NAD(P))
MNTPSQLLHAFRFHLMLRAPMSQQEALTCLAQHPFCAITEKFDSNKIFELGRRYGFQGRIFSHAIVCTSSILIQGQSIKGWAFIPQEGNSILSTMESFLHQTNHPDVSMTMARLTAELLRHWW